MEVDDCWAAETDSDCVTVSSRDGDSDGLETVADPVAEQLVEHVAELVPESVVVPFLNKLLNQYLYQFLNKLLKQLLFKFLTKWLQNLLRTRVLSVPKQNGLLKSGKNSTGGRGPEIAWAKRPILHYR